MPPPRSSANVKSVKPLNVLTAANLDPLVLLVFLARTVVPALLDVPVNLVNLADLPLTATHQLLLLATLAHLDLLDPLALKDLPAILAATAHLAAPVKLATLAPTDLPDPLVLLANPVPTAAQANLVLLLRAPQPPLAIPVLKANPVPKVLLVPQVNPAATATPAHKVLVVLPVPTVNPAATANPAHLVNPVPTDLLANPVFAPNTARSTEASSSMAPFASFKHFSNFLQTIARRSLSHTLPTTAVFAIILSVGASSS